MSLLAKFDNVSEDLMMRKKLISLLLAVTLVFTLGFTGLTAIAAGTSYTPYADTLKELGLFLGTNKGYELERNATRGEAAVMAVRLLGKEKIAETEKNVHPFTDVPSWASAHVGYLYGNQITGGTSATKYSSNALISPAQYATFMLRALGYSEAAGDFTWQKSLDKMAELGIITKAQATEYAKSAATPRGVLVALSRATLLAKPKGSYYSLLCRLYSKDKAFTYAQLKAAAKRDAEIETQSFLLGVPVTRASSAKALNSEEIFAKASPAVFYIEVFSEGYSYAFASGSGFFISSGGIAVTNAHVIEGASSAKIHTSDGKIYEVETVLAVSTALDIALLKIKGSQFPFLKLGDPATLRTAQRIYCIGSPLGMENTISDGLVSSPIRKYEIAENRELIQISAAISRGSSGGALLNEYGEVVGITTYSTYGQNLNFAVPISDMSQLRLNDPPKTMKAIVSEARWVWPDSLETKTEIEPNDETPTQLLTARTVFSCALRDADDVDLWKIEAKGSTEFYITLRADAAHYRHITLEVIHQETGQVVLSSRTVEDAPFRYIRGHLAKGDNYVLRISSDGAENVNWNQMPYEFVCYTYDTFTSPTWPEDYLVWEIEPNDTPETAQYFDFADTVSASLSSAADKDYYSFTLDQSTAVSFLLFSWYGSAKDKFKAELYDKDMNLVANLAFSDYSSLNQNKRTLAAGVYYVLVSAKSTALLEEDYELFIGNLDPDYVEYYSY